MNKPRHTDGKVHGVIVGVFDDQGRILLIRRSEHVIAPLTVCFPGGGIEIGEEHAPAAFREFHEEVGGKIQPLREIWVWDAPDRPLKLFGWSAKLLSSPQAFRPDPREVAELLWLTPQEAGAHPDRLFGTELFVESLVRDRKEHPHD